MTLPRRSDRRFVYGWLIVAVSFAVILIGAGTRSAPGALLLGMEADTGWSKAEISLAGAAGLLLLGLGGPASGFLIDRFGVRRLTVAALVLTAVGMALSAMASEVWQLVVVFGLLSGFGAGLVASVLGPVVASRWFSKARTSSRSKRHVPISSPMSFGAAFFDAWYSQVASAGGADASQPRAS